MSGGNKQDAQGRKPDKTGCLEAFGGCCGADGPGFLASLLFLALFGLVFGAFHLVMRWIGRDPETWSGTGAVFTAILLASLGIAGYAWYWMERHGK